MLKTFFSRIILVLTIFSLCVATSIMVAGEVQVEEWTAVTRDSLFSVFMIDANDGWAVGSSGTTIHWNGTSWNMVSTPKTTQLNSVFMVSTDDGWAVGSSGTIIHWDGTSWNEVTSPTTEYLTSVFMIDANDGWAVGGYTGRGVSTILHWDGTSWNEVTSPAPHILHSVSMTGPDEGWVVGDYGTIIRFARARKPALDGSFLRLTSIIFFPEKITALTSAIGVSGYSRLKVIILICDI